MMKANDISAGTVDAGLAVGHCNIPLVHSLFTDDWIARELPMLGRFYRSNQSILALEEALSRLPWNPDMLFICSGFDSHKEECGDEITNWTDADFQYLTQLALFTAARSNCPVLSVHSGGYKPEITLRAAAIHIRTLAGEL